MDVSAKSDWDHFGCGARQWPRQSAAMGRNVTELIVEAAQVTRGMRILDVACGPGEPTLSLATLLEGTGEVIGIDIAPEALRVAEERVTSHGLTNVQFQQADVHELPFPDNTFDRITCRLGVMFFSDLLRAAREMQRVLKLEGKVVLLTWGPMEQPYFETTAGTVLRFLHGAALPDSAKRVFAFGAAGALGGVLSDAGFKNVEERFLTAPWTWPGSPEEVWAYFQEVAVPFAPLLRSIPSGRRSEVDQAVLNAIARYYDGTEIKFTAIVNITSATK
jgi:ubiquinone/menaquinone biosynthesis C-methylase UbiE